MKRPSSSALGRGLKFGKTSTALVVIFLGRIAIYFNNGSACFFLEETIIA